MLDWHHIFGRGRNAFVSEPLASHIDLGANLCRPCHTEITDNPHNRAARILEWQAVEKVANRWGLTFTKAPGADPVAVMARFEREMRENGRWEQLKELAGMA